MSSSALSIVLDALSEPKNETLAEHRRHCEARPGNCPFERDAIRHSQIANAEIAKTDTESPDAGDNFTPTQKSEHYFRVTPDGQEVPANTAFKNELMSNYDKAHRIYATSDLHTTDLNDLDINDYGIVVIGGDFIKREEEEHGFSGEMTGREKKASAEKWLNGKLLPFIKQHSDKQFVIIPGNHDKYFEYFPDSVDWPQNAHFLIDGEANVNGLRFYGTPWCYHHLNGAFEVGHKELAQHFAKIPEGIDVLVTHSPPSDGKNAVDFDPSYNGHFGASELAEAIKAKKPKLVLCGHVHTGEHKPTKFGDSTVINVSKIGTKRKERAFAGRAIGFKKGDGEIADFFIDHDDGGQISKYAYANHGAKIGGMLREDGSIGQKAAYSVVKNAAVSINIAHDRGHRKPDPNSMGLFDYVRDAIAKLPDGDYNNHLKAIAKEIDVSKKNGYASKISHVHSPPAPKFSDLTLEKLALIRKPKAVQAMMEINAAARIIAKSINMHVDMGDNAPNPMKVNRIDPLVKAYGGLYTSGAIHALPAEDQRKATKLRDYLLSLVDARSDGFVNKVGRVDYLW